MKPHEIAACVKKVFTEHPEKFRQGSYFIDGGFCALGAAILCVDPDVDIFHVEEYPLNHEVSSFKSAFYFVVGDRVDSVNDRQGLLAIMAGLEKVIEEGLKHEIN